MTVHNGPEYADGKTRLSFDDQERLLNVGDVVIIEPGQIHACNPIDGRPRSYHMLYIDSQWCLNKLSGLYSTPVERASCDQLIVQQPGLHHLFLALVEKLQKGDITKANQEFEKLTFHVLSQWCSPEKPKEETNALSYRIKRRLLNDLVTPLALNRLAEEFDRSTETIIRTFRKRFGITPKSFFNNARIEHAKLLLREGSSIVDAAGEVGFSDQSQFHRAFVNYTASTPRQYQQAQSIFDNIS